MRLPNARRAVVSRAKVLYYLLNDSHPRGKSKAVFFRRLGFTAADPQALEAELRRVAVETDIQSQAKTEFGIRYVIDGWILSPAAARAEIRTVWFVDHGTETPRFVTAHPIRRRR